MMVLTPPVFRQRASLPFTPVLPSFLFVARLVSFLLSSLFLSLHLPLGSMVIPLPSQSLYNSSLSCLLTFFTRVQFPPPPVSAKLLTAKGKS